MESLRRVWQKVRWSLGQHGLRGTVRQALRRVFRPRGATKPAVHPFDEQYGTETSGLISGGALSSGHGHDQFATAYYGVSPSRMRSALAQWSATPGTRPVEEYTFLDIGSGKGRALMLASELPFREVIGVELNAGLAQVAEKNLKLWQEHGRSVSPMRQIRGDALAVDLPQRPLLIFLYNPFHAPMMRRLLERVNALAGNRRGGIDVLYVVAQQDAVFAEFPNFELLWSDKIWMSEQDAAADLVSSPEERCSLYRR
jgi:SAM-dependent methyltransferase